MVKIKRIDLDDGRPVTITAELSVEEAAHLGAYR